MTLSNGPGLHPGQPALPAAELLRTARPAAFAPNGRRLSQDEIFVARLSLP
jgi:hypothetical protein